MELTASLADRIARTRRQQSRALSGVGLTPAKTDIVAPVATRRPATPSVPQVIEPQRRDARTPLIREDLLKEFETLLPAITSMYKYEPQDIALIRDRVCADRPGALRELQDVIRQYRIEIVSMGFDGMNGPDGVTPLLPFGAACRARIQFRIDCMGKSVDENGQIYTAGILDWAPETMDMGIPLMHIPAPAVNSADEPIVEITPAAPSAETKPAKRPKP